MVCPVFQGEWLRHLRCGIWIPSLRHRHFWLCPIKWCIRACKITWVSIWDCVSFFINLFLLANDESRQCWTSQKQILHNGFCGQHNGASVGQFTETTVIRMFTLFCMIKYSFRFVTEMRSNKQLETRSGIQWESSSIWFLWIFWPRIGYASHSIATRFRGCRQKTDCSSWSESTREIEWIHQNEEP